MYVYLFNSIKKIEIINSQIKSKILEKKILPTNNITNHCIHNNIFQCTDTKLYYCLNKTIIMNNLTWPP